MAETSTIAWCDATWNPWIGCSKVSPGCDHCYAEQYALRYGRTTWGKDTPRPPTKTDVPDRLQRRAECEGRRMRLFCASLADVYEPRRDLDGPRQQVLAAMRRTPLVDWLTLTKRPRFAVAWLNEVEAPPNVWLGTSTEDQRWFDRRANVLREAKNVAIRFLSAEPLLGPLDLSVLEPRSIDWIIVGGESGPGARPCDVGWIESIVDQCRARGIVPFVKQLGSRPVDGGKPLRLRHGKGEDPSEWPAALNVQEFPMAARGSVAT